MLLATAIFASACTTTEAPSNDLNNETDTPVVEESASVPFAELGMDITDARKEYSLFRFVEMEGTCLDMGFPTNLVYKGTNMIMTEDEKFFDRMTMSDFTGTIRFKNLPLDGGNAKCTIKTAKGINTATFSCTLPEVDEEGAEADVEVCTGSFKIMAEK